MQKLILVPLLFLLASYVARAEVFTVTNNNDAGTGSFRDAILNANANGNGELDYIYFNIPATTIADRTIQILTDLPEIKSDIVIDASSQPDAPLSANGAKVILDGLKLNYTFFTDQVVINVNGANRFELYGLVIKNFYAAFNGFITGRPAVNFKGILQTIKIGAIGKGNVVYNGGGIYGTAKNLEIKSNFFNIAEDGVTIAKTYLSSNTLSGYNAIIGGDTKLDGNIFYGIFNYSPFNLTAAEPENYSLKLKNNIFTANNNEERPGITVEKNTAYVYISGPGNTTHPLTATIDITENVFGAGVTMINLNNTDIHIWKNFFGTSRDLTKNIPIQTQALNFRNITGKVLVGGPIVADGNVFTNTNDEISFQKLYPGAIWAENALVEFSHNSHFCNKEYPFLYAYVGPFNKPLEVFLDDLSATTVKGRTKPGARVELFYSDPECTNCQPKRFFAEVTADASGNWEYNGALETGFTVLAGATLNHISSEFSDPRIYLIGTGQGAIVTPQTCPQPNGKIEGVYLVNVHDFAWYNENGDIVGTDLILKDVPAGKYRLKANQFGCSVTSDWIVVEDRMPQLAFTATANLIHPSCGQKGSILNLYPNNYSDFSWLDQNGNIVGKERELKDVPAGSYTLHLIGTTGCMKDFGPYVLKNTNGLSVDYTHLNKLNTSCGSQTGSITGITVTGTGNITYKWTNELNTVVGNSLDLENVGAGTYKLEINDESACPEVFSQAYTISEINGITMDETLAIAKESACSSNTGSIKKITVSGATDYKWVNKNGNIISTALELENAAPGDYKLIASNGYGCVKESKFYTINQAVPATFPNYVINKTDASCDLDNGTITLQLGNGLQPSSLRWVNAQNVVVDITANPKNLKDGDYRLYLTDENQCEALYRTITIDRIQRLSVSINEIIITNDNCAQGIGKIENVVAKNGKAPYVYIWKNEAGQQLASTSNLGNLKAGNYFLTVTDALDCEVTGIKIEVSNETSLLPTPIVDPINICGTTTVQFSVKNKMKDGIYKLYETSSSSKPIMESTDGTFRIDANANSIYYLSFAVGACESNRGQVSIELNGAELKIPNSFSPNNDGINDYWKIPGIEKYTMPSIKLFNRYGTLVFEQNGPNLKFDGKYKGDRLPTGVYYYTLLLSNNCKQISGSLLIL